MISISFPDNFVPERTYIIDVLFGDFLGLQYAAQPDSNARDYRIALDNGHRLIVEDWFFGKHDEGKGYGSRKDIPTTTSVARNQFTAERDIPVIYGTDRVDLSSAPAVIHCSLDIFGSSFFMLTRWEERANPAMDEHGRFPASASLAFKGGFLDRPVVNEYAEMLWNMLRYVGCDQERKQRRFQFVPTHDVDHPRLWGGPFGFVKSFGGDLWKRRSPGLALANLTHFVRSKIGRAGDPYDTFDFLMSVSEKEGLRSEFYFMGGGVTPFDTRYRLDETGLKTLLAEIDGRGHVIGFHPSYGAGDSPAQWEREWELLARVSPQPVTRGRQHYLRFDLPATWQVWEDHGMHVDGTLGYPEREGFRCGTCYEFPVFNIVSRRKLRLRERPLIAMDGTFVEYQQLSVEETEARIARLMATVERYRGDFVFLWHNSSFNLPPWRRFHGLYEKVVAAGKTDQCGG